MIAHLKIDYRPMVDIIDHPGHPANGPLLWSVETLLEGETCVQKWRNDCRSKLRYLSKSDNLSWVKPLAREGNQTNQSWWFLPWRILHQQLQLPKKEACTIRFFSTFYIIAENNCTYCYVHVSRFPDFSTGAEYANAGGEASSLE